MTENGRHDLVVIGASAGGIEALTSLVAGLPADLAAAVCIVLHIPPTGTSALPRILDRVASMPVVSAQNEMPIESGMIYVAPSDHHLLVERGMLELTNGPRENRHRPAVDPLFRSAARSYDSRVIGVILSGMQDDGTLGLMAIKRRGGVAIVQSDPLFSGMPTSAAEHVAIDYSLPAHEIGTLIGDLAGIGREEGMPQPDPEASALPGEEEGKPSVFACPECHGVLWELEDGSLVHYRCRVGHAYTAETLSTAQTEAFEAALWTALRALEEKQSLAERMRRHAEERGHDRAAALYREQAEESATRAAIVRAAIRTGVEEAG